jgi:hypothetical protein
VYRVPCGPEAPALAARESRLDLFMLIVPHALLTVPTVSEAVEG